MSFSEYVKWFTAVYGPEATDMILDVKNECINKDKDELINKLKNHKRVVPIEDQEKTYHIKGCNKCIEEGLNVWNQDTPNFMGRINDNEYIIIGLEPRIKEDIHIAFEKESGDIHPLFKKLSLFKNVFSQIKERAYVTDLAKCMSTNYPEARKICMKFHLIEELKILIGINPEFKIILQGTGVEKHFIDKIEPVSNKENDTIKTKDKKKLLFRCEYLIFNGKKIPTVVFPHASTNTSSQWKQIKEHEISKIEAKLIEFGF